MENTQIFGLDGVGIKIGFQVEAMHQHIEEDVIWKILVSLSKKNLARSKNSKRHSKCEYEKKYIPITPRNANARKALQLYKLHRMV